MMEHYKNVLHGQINEKKRRKESQRKEILKEGEDLIVQSREHDQIIMKTMKEKIDQIR